MFLRDLMFSLFMNSLETLQFKNLLELVSRNAQTPMGKARLENLRPITSKLELERDLRLVAEAIYLTQTDANWQFSEIFDPSEAVSILRIRNATLEPVSMLELVRLCNQALFARSAISAEKENAATLWQIVEQIPNELSIVIGKTNKRLLPSGEIDDSASPELARLRREINLQRGRLQKSLENVMRTNSNAVQDEIVTIRNERFVIPVKNDFTGKIGGVAHGTSSSGATVFIEPLEAIEANNLLQTLKAQEEREIARILFSLTEDLRENLPAIEIAVEAVAELDFIKTKVAFAQKFNAVVPEISDDETLDLVDARHPLLENNLRNANQTIEKPRAGDEQKENYPQINTDKHRLKTKDQKPKTENQNQEIVPVSFKLTKQNSVMIISGANAGGKTVVLKTAGLLSLMAISGLPVPAKKAKIPFYKSVLADIGDHQSLSANLSTFSSHISNIAEMMRNCNAPSLVLLDEVGTGTDPEEGSALGVAIVDYFRRQCRAQVVASTHYRGLKIYAANDEDVINASVEFDEKTLQPTYRLLTGLAGASSGIEIARRFGILNEVIETARKNLDISAREAENYLYKLQNESKIAEDLRHALEEEREAVAAKFAALEIEAKKKEKERRREFEQELAETIDGFERQSKAFIKTIEDKALKTKLEKERQKRKAELNRAVLKTVQSPSSVQSPKSKVQSPFKNDFLTNNEQRTTNKPIEIGSQVLTSFGTVGKVEKIDGKTAEVLVGSMRMREKMKDLQVVEQQEQSKAQSPKSKVRKSAINLDAGLETSDTSAELNLIGKTTADAEFEVDRFLDDSYIAALPKVRIIHGFGTGALKNFVHHFLKGHPHVEKFAFAPRDQGGNGATIVELKR